jgi:N-acyl-D-aspartate/D-glutamate deacylase
MYDLIIEDARIVDGTGAPAFAGSLCVREGVIEAIHRRTRTGEACAERIDAGGLVLAPGFVDPHTHYDAQVAWDPLLTCSPWHGVTTVVMGNCGVGVAPMRPETREIALWDLVNVEAIPFDAMSQGIDWQWESFGEYLDAIETRGVGINVAALAPLTPLRHYAMGEASFDRAANRDEIRVMEGLLRDALQAGAFGFSTTMLNNHVGYGGRPLACRSASHEELAALSRVLREAGHGAIELALTQTDLGWISDEELELLELLVRESGRPVTYLALINEVGNPQSYLRSVERLGPMLDWQRAVPQINCQPMVRRLTMDNPFTLGNLASFAPIFNKSEEEQLRIYASESFRNAAKDELAKRGIPRGMVGRLRVGEAKGELAQSYARTRQTMDEIAEETGRHALDVLCDLTLAEGVGLSMELAFANFEPEGVANLLQDGRFMIGLSDGGAHVEQLCDAGFSTHLLGRWVREHQAISLEEAVRDITSVPADFWGIRGRGRLVEGHAADLVLFDPESVIDLDPEYVHDLPGGARRYVSRARGIEATIVGGKVLYRAGDYQGGLPGTVLRSGA